MAKNEIMIFEGREVEVFEFDGQVLFNPRHVADCLELEFKTVQNHMSTMNYKQVVKLTNNSISRISGFRKIHSTGENFLTESGVYKLTFKSRTPGAEKFQDWVTDDVLPAIRQNGFYSANPGVGLLDESARNSNVVHYSVAGLCREADRFLGGKTALKALNFFTGMPVEDLLRDLEESKKEKEACGVTGFTSRPPATVLEFISSHCSFGPDKTVTKNELYQDYVDYCESNGEKPEIRSMFFKVLMNHPKAGLEAKQCRRGNGEGSRYRALIGIGLKEVVED